MARILLTSTPYTVEYFMPGRPVEHLGLAYLSAYASEAGHETHIIDTNIPGYSLDDLYAEANQFDVIGFTLYSTNLKTTKLAISKLRKDGYEGHITLGGHLVSLWPEYLRTLPGSDTIVMGEGEKTLIELAGRVGNDKGWGDVQGISYIDNRTGCLHTKGKAAALEDISIYPDRSIYKEILNDSSCISISSSRGCDGTCSFCSISQFCKLHSNNKWRGRHPDNVVNELHHLVQEYGAVKFLFVDDNFIPDTDTAKSRAFEIARLLVEADMGISYSVEFRPGWEDFELLDIMVKSGLNGVYLGLESVVKRQQILYSKKIEIDKFRTLVKVCDKLGLYTTIFTIFFDPLVSFEELRVCMDFVEETGPEYFYDIAGYLKPIPGTRIHSRLNMTGVVVDDRPISPGSEYFINTEFRNEQMLNLLCRFLHIRDEVIAEYREEFYSETDDDVVLDIYRKMKRQIYIESRKELDALL